MLRRSRFKRRRIRQRRKALSQSRDSAINFRIKSIRKKTPKKIPVSQIKEYIKKTFGKPIVSHSALALLVLLIGGLVIIHGIGALKIGQILSALSGTVGKELKIDQSGRTNLLLLGTAGEGHEGKLLTDTIILASIDYQDERVSMLSLPRDLYIETKEIPGNRINSIYEFAEEKFGEGTGLEFVRFTLTEQLNIPIHYIGRIDFKGFEKMIDELGGITVHVERDINDLQYPKDGTYDYEPFHLSAGTKNLDGKTALKYVRSRGDSSDFERSNRQQQVLLAIKEKASPGRLRGLYGALREHSETNMDLREMITLAEIGASFDKSDVYHFRLHDDPAQKGGFLYPPVRELYGGAYVLLPASDKWDELKRYINLIMEYPEWLQNNVSIQVLNGTGFAGVAGSMKSILQRYGFLTPRFGNASSQSIEKTTAFVKNQEKAGAVEALKTLFPVELSFETPQKYLEPPYASDTDIVLEFGKDFLPRFSELDVFRFVFDMTPKPQNADPE